MFGTKLKKIAVPIAAVLALGIGLGADDAYAATTSVCPNDGTETVSGTRVFELTTQGPVTNSCYFWDPGNDNNNDDFNAQRSTDFGADHVLVSKVEFNNTGGLQREGTNPNLLGQSFVDLLGGTSGTFSLDTTGFIDILLVFKTGNGGGNPDFAAFSLAPPGPTTGNWSVSLQQGLSHVSLYGSPAPIPLPAAGFLLLTALGGLGLTARRRRKDS